ncbi:hypothetical protein H8A95_26605 [Bradyrhizobium sp. Pear76]|uniref:hypothetical protein n=1 Tax=Bradyrhizobium oropedii TaxID=1571201 RepID=UPI001E3587EE|nr:hypothetical protein [Bradyrhizobium oropedii]MCC8965792.1 hypothetical protein [Bradyrhizobium oropedii]
MPANIQRRTVVRLTCIMTSGRRDKVPRRLRLFHIIECAKESCSSSVNFKRYLLHFASTKVNGR